MKRPSNVIFGIGLAVVVTLMFSFAYANVPLFQLFCQRFGLGGSAKAGVKGEAVEELPSSTTGNVLARTVNVKFMGIATSGLPVRFGPSTPAILVRPGKPIHVEYTFTNMSDDSVYFRAVHSIRPTEGAKEFQLMQCFCFDDQTLGPRETRSLPVYFALSPRFPANVNELVLNYSLFPRDPKRDLPVSASQAN